jgi:cytoskeletal protein CcmA (bactofilin family)
MIPSQLKGTVKIKKGSCKMFNKSKQDLPQRSNTSSKGTSVLGPTLTFRGGELSADEDLIIEGTVEGTITHQSHNLTIGRNGRVKADVKARMITVQGTVQGDLYGDEAVYIASTGQVHGNVVSPRVAIEDGASFSGKIDTTQPQPGGAADISSRPTNAVATMAGSVGVLARRETDSERAEVG